MTKNSKTLGLWLGQRRHANDLQIVYTE